MKRTIPAVLPLALLLAALPAIAADGPRVQLGLVEEQPIYEEVRLNGTVTPLRSARISAGVAGLVGEVAVEAGDRAARGDPLIGLDAAPARADRDAARAAVREGEAALAEARRRFREAESMGAGQNIPATEVRARESAVDRAEAELARLRAELQRAEVALGRHRVEAPFGGVVSSRSTELGEWVTPGDELLRLVDTDHLRLDFPVPQPYYRRLDDRAELRVRVDNEATMPARIDALIPVSDSAARTFQLRAHPPEGLDALPGMAVEGVLRLETGRRAPAVPGDALNRYPDGRVTVWVAEPTDDPNRYNVREQQVETGLRFGNRVAIRAGLDGGEQVVTRGNEALNAGMTVRPTANGGAD